MKKLTGLFLLICISLTTYCQNNLDNTIDSIKQKRRNGEFFEGLSNKYFPESELTTIDNEKIIFKKLNGKIVYINFWFKSCAPCMAEMKGLKKLYDKYKNDKIEFLMITFEDQNTINEIKNKFELEYKMITVERHKIENWWITQGFPTHLILDKNGKIIYGQSGGLIDEEKATKEVLNVFSTIIEKYL